MESHGCGTLGMGAFNVTILLQHRPSTRRGTSPNFTAIVRSSSIHTLRQQAFQLRRYLQSWASEIPTEHFPWLRVVPALADRGFLGDFLNHVYHGKSSLGVYDPNPGFGELIEAIGICIKQPLLPWLSNSTINSAQSMADALGRVTGCDLDGFAGINVTKRYSGIIELAKALREGNLPILHTSGAALDLISRRVIPIPTCQA
mmetsp:Transcript_7563/g.34264  ORF Transcript_7563/g.34264 Transcript_7563/m.34264 type:complete len:202 (+) Transcript_7563:1676-2281(+)